MKRPKPTAAPVAGSGPATAPRAWLVKTEPSVFSFADLWRSADRTTLWDGIRNYQARNYLRDEMRVDDVILVYHSNASPSGVAGLARVAGEARPDPSQFDATSRYVDPASSPDEPRWWAVPIQATAPLPRLVGLAELKADPVLQRLDLVLVRRGNRLSVMPLPSEAVARIEALARG